MEDKKYNGWTNYATWRINLEIFDSWATDHTQDKDFEKFESITDLVDHLKDYAEECVHSTSLAERGQTNFALDYALEFMSYVNYCEIAEHIVEDYPQIMNS